MTDIEKIVAADMFCNQCEQAAGPLGCTVKGVCGKEADTSAAQAAMDIVSTHTVAELHPPHSLISDDHTGRRTGAGREYIWPHDFGGYHSNECLPEGLTDVRLYYEEGGWK
ncbi:hydroxylamine reductase/Ni-containing CO dehydrogenase [Kipferlia bialata]|uniref:Hydroxylamine reductase/Ni-containing CO dehydrogenase n=1 Tax=Kipferlia bialata TaxID=797122 RepID=A0A9K3CTM1_9EUKA|nr:hydroxylamine reductase/Ni-containing CO dehydrogenase [Kipferlia bialata]|eukprot:g2329.t1